MASSNITFNINVVYTCNWCVSINPFTCHIHGKENLEAYKRQVQAEQANQWMAEAMKRVMQERIEVIGNIGGRAAATGFRYRPNSMVVGFDSGAKYTAVAMSPSGRLTWAQTTPDTLHAQSIKDLALKKLGEEIDEYYWPSQAIKSTQEVKRSMWESLYGGPPLPPDPPTSYQQLREYIKRYGPHYHDPQAGYHNPNNGLVAAADYMLQAYNKRDIEATLRMRVHQAICVRECCCNDPTPIINTGGITMERRQVLLSQMRRLEKELAVLDRFPERDPFDNGAVLMFERVFGTSWESVKDSDTVQKYTYAALKVSNAWYLTGSGHSTPQGVSWGALTEWLGESVGEIVVMTESVSLEGFVANKDNVTVTASGNFTEGSLGANDPREQ